VPIAAGTGLGPYEVVSLIGAGGRGRVTRPASKAANTIYEAMSAAIGEKIVTYDVARLMEGAREVKCSEFASAITERM